MAEDSEDRTEAASARRLERAREEGNVPVSREMAALAVLGAGALVTMMAGPGLASGLARRMAVLLEQAHALEPVAALRLAALEVVRTAAPFVLAALLAGAMGVLLQTGFLVNGNAIKFDLARLSPSRGLSRIFGVGALLEVGKSVLKVVVVGVAAWTALAGALPLLRSALNWDAGQLLDRTTRQIVHVLLAMLVAQAVIATLDVVRARLRHARELRMSRQELREEHKDSEGDPAIKARIRRLRLARSRRRMMAAVPTATVVVTNPTHYAVALAYDRNQGGAPRIVAKGVDAMAARIREAAQDARVPIVSNPPLARALYPVELDREVPMEHFQAVAEIIAYVWRLRGRAA
jgi:flagellar biosynthetic protein FlhB